MSTVLLIESNPVQSVAVREHLAKIGFSVLLALRGDEGLRMATQYQPDLILLDAQLPDATGFQLCRSLNEHPATKSIPVVLVSGLAQYSNQQQFGRERGAMGFLKKPVKLVELGEMVGNFFAPRETPLGDQVKLFEAGTYDNEKLFQEALDDWMSKALTRRDNAASDSRPR